MVCVVLPADVVVSGSVVVQVLFSNGPVVGAVWDAVLAATNQDKAMAVAEIQVGMIPSIEERVGVPYGAKSRKSLNVERDRKRTRARSLFEKHPNDCFTLSPSVYLSPISAESIDAVAEITENGGKGDSCCEDGALHITSTGFHSEGSPGAQRLCGSAASCRAQTVGTSLADGGTKSAATA